METRVIRDQASDRDIGKYWENQFIEVIVPFGFSGDSISGGLKDDKIIWTPDGNEVYVQIRHKDSYWKGKELRHVYGYESYRLENDLRITTEAQILGIYVIHDYTHFGKYSKENRPQDWYAQFFNVLSQSIDDKSDGWTYYGDSFQLKEICYWKLPKFPPLTEILNQILIDTAFTTQGSPSGRLAERY